MQRKEAIREGVLPPERFIYRIYTCFENANEQLILNKVEYGFLLNLPLCFEGFGQLLILLIRLVNVQFFSNLFTTRTMICPNAVV